MRQGDKDRRRNGDKHQKSRHGDKGTRDKEKMRKRDNEIRRLKD
jgi:hypothetical protein